MKTARFILIIILLLAFALESGASAPVFQARFGFNAEATLRSPASAQNLFSPGSIDDGFTQIFLSCLTSAEKPQLLEMGPDKMRYLITKKRKITAEIEPSLADPHEIGVYLDLSIGKQYSQ